MHIDWSPKSVIYYLLVVRHSLLRSLRRARQSDCWRKRESQDRVLGSPATTYKYSSSFPSVCYEH